MNIQFYNCPNPARFDTKILPKEKPLFLDYRPDFSAMEAVVTEYKDYANILVVGHGGSVSSASAFYNALNQSESHYKHVEFLMTVDPEYIAAVKQRLSSDSTLVLAISKSGADTTQLEMLTQFSGFTTVVITEKNTPLHTIAQKQNWHVVPHPPIGGRFSGFTEVGLLPALLAGIDIDALFRGAKELYSQYSKDNVAFRAASVFCQLEQQGFVDVLGLVYSHYLHFISPLAVQLCHESFGKDGKGQSYMFAEAPEVQHHTVQRLLGGRKNMVAWFTGLHHYTGSAKSAFPVSLHSVTVRDHALFDLNGIPLGQSMAAELTGTLEATRIANIPAVHLELSNRDPIQVGSLVAFWQLFAVYSSVLRGVNPFDQQAVEQGKQISFNKRLEYKHLN